ncbi:Protein monoglycylase ttll8 [Cichlidogyrus casuarinus]|uniref:Protein monoglycylase ttll8 n=1 Tax=Cichlidogyrus casuarinus TaxID=1844966 RepID=A0ABD2Q1W1_9PLAT
MHEIKSKMLKLVNPSFIWTLRKSQVNIRYLRKDQIFNHLTSAPFTTKIGLYRSLQELPWVKETSTSSFFPRCYIITETEERLAFIDDFRLTACLSLIRRVIAAPEVSDTPQVGFVEESEAEQGCSTPLESVTDRFYMKSASKFRFRSNPFPLLTSEAIMKKEAPEEVIIFAILHSKYKIYEKNHLDIDSSKPFISISPDQWRVFLTWTYKIFQDAFKVQNVQMYRLLCKQIHKEFSDSYDQESIDGQHNIWILKPGAKSRGRGIGCFNQLDAILKSTECSLPVCGNRLVVQKYIERPLLVYNTKFDIRQWFLVTDWNPLTIWWYNECYFRFCSHEFTLDRMDESVHLSNNSIQYKYKVNRKSQAIPSYNMWYLDEFLLHLNEKGTENLWHNRVLPGMKDAVISSMLCSQGSIDPRKNCFEVFGADFMISEPDFNPWLIEINSSPCMAPSTEVTAHLTPMILEDAVKVAVDRRFDRNALTGKFEMIYRQSTITTPLYLGMDLTVSGVQVCKPRRVIPIGPANYLSNKRESVENSQLNGAVKRQIPSSPLIKTTQIKTRLPTRDLNNNEPVKKGVNRRSIAEQDKKRKQIDQVKNCQSQTQRTETLKPNLKPYNLTKVELVSLAEGSKNTTDITDSQEKKTDQLKSSSYTDSYLKDEKAAVKSTSQYANRSSRDLMGAHLVKLTASSRNLESAKHILVIGGDTSSREETKKRLKRGFRCKLVDACESERPLMKRCLSSRPKLEDFEEPQVIEMKPLPRSTSASPRPRRLLTPRVHNVVNLFGYSQRRAPVTKKCEISYKDVMNTCAQRSRQSIPHGLPRGLCILPVVIPFSSYADAKNLSVNSCDKKRRSIYHNSSNPIPGPQVFKFHRTPRLTDCCPLEFSAVEVFQFIAHNFSLSLFF